MMRTSKDEGKTWVNPKQLSQPDIYTGLTNGRSIRLSSGRILLEVWVWVDNTGEEDYCYCVFSDDDGKTWENFRNIEDVSDDAWAYPAITWVGNRALITYFNYKGGLSLKLKSLPSEWFYQ